MKTVRALAVSVAAIAALTAALAPAPAPAAVTCGQWNVIPSPNVSIPNFLLGAAAVAPTNVWAVGYYLNGANTDQTLVEHWNGTQWSVVASPNPANGQDARLDAVAAIAPNDVWAVGDYANGLTNPVLIEHWNGLQWSMVPGPSTPSTAVLAGVDGDSATDVWAVGAYYDGTNFQTLVERWNGTTWGVVPTATVSFPYAALFFGVAIVSPTDVWAAGRVTSGNTNYPLLEHWNGTQWSVVPGVPVPSGTTSAELNAITAASSNNVWAVGESFNGSTFSQQTLVEHWDGAQWSLVPSPSLTNSPVLSGVAASSASDVWAVGQQGVLSLIDHWNGSSISHVSNPQPGANVNQLNAVTALADGEAWAVGMDDSKTLVEYYCPLAADLAVTKTASPNPVAVGGNLTYSLTVRNLGPAPATGVGLTDPLPSGVTFVGASTTHGSCAGTTTVSCNLGTMARGATATVTIVVRPTAAGPLTNTATVAGNEPDPNPTNNRSSVTTRAAGPDLGITVSDAPDPVTADGNLTYTETVSAAGATATGVTVVDTLPSNVIFRSASATQGSCSGTATVTCNVGSMAAGSTATITIVVTPIAPGTLSNTAAVSPSDSTPADNSATATTTVAAASRTRYVSLRDGGFDPTAANSAQGYVVQWNFFGPSPNSVGDGTGLGLFASPVVNPVSYFRFAYMVAGSYAVLDGLTHSSAVRIPVKVSPAAGTTATTYTITWAAGAPPAGDVADVRIAYCATTPCTRVFTTWRAGTSATSAIFAAGDPAWRGAGAYYFGARLRKPSSGKASAWSPAVPIAVS